MKDRRIGFFVALICLPAALIIGYGATLVILEVPRAIRMEPSRIGREYREIAEDFIAHPDRATYVGNRLKGWQQVSRINGIPWGYERNVDKDGRLVRVWFKSGQKEWRAIVIGAIRPFPYAVVFYGGGTLVALALIGLTALAVVCFTRYVKSRDDFLAATAHDLTTPLVGMRFTIGADDDAARVLNERMIRLVGNLKDFLRLGGRRGEPVRTVFDLRAAYDEAYRLFRDDYRDLLGGDVPVEMPDGPLAVYADEMLTVQVLWNLLGNDLKYAAPYGPVSVRICRAGDAVALDVIDEGQGMTPQQMRRCFDRYYRAKTVKVSGKGGFGIGLCTAREFARTMGGDLTVGANKPTGCVFTLTLPISAKALPSGETTVHDDSMVKYRSA